MSLSLLLDYRPEDTKEHSFEVSLFAELFNEMLMRDFGFNVYKALCELPEKPKEKEKDEKKKKDDEKKEERKDEEKKKDDDNKKKDDEKKKDYDKKDYDKKDHDKKDYEKKEYDKKDYDKKDHDKKDYEKNDKKDDDRRKDEKKEEKDRKSEDKKDKKEEEKRRERTRSEHGDSEDDDDYDEDDSKDKKKEKGERRKRDRPKMFTKDRHLLLSFGYFDQTHCGYIFEKDIEDLLYTLGLSLSRAQVRKLVGKVISRDSLHYRKLTDKPKEEDFIVIDDSEKDNNSHTLALGNKHLLPVFEPEDTANVKSKVPEADSNQQQSEDGSSFDNLSPTLSKSTQI